MKKMKFIIVPVVLIQICALFCFAQKASDYGKITISPMDSGVKISGNEIFIEPKSEDTTYIISGHFDGQIICKTKNTVLKLNNAYLENNLGKAAIYAEAKTEISTSKGSTNYVVSSGNPTSKTAAIHSKKNLVLGGSGTLYVKNESGHAVKADDIKMKGSGVFYLTASKKCSAINCESFTVEKDKTFSCYLRDSKNGIKADGTIRIASGIFYFENNETAMKTDTKEDDKKAGISPIEHGIFITGGKINYKNNKALYETEKGKYKSYL